MKLILGEVGTEGAVEAWNAADRRVSSMLLYVEARSALARAARDGVVPRGALVALRRRTDALWRKIDGIDVTEPILRAAGRATEEHALRAYDAVHLASMEAVADGETVFVSADPKLVEAAHARGLATFSVAR